MNNCDDDDIEKMIASDPNFYQKPGHFGLIVAATADNLGIGTYDGRIPWKINKDYARFKEITTRPTTSFSPPIIGLPIVPNCVIMGRLTWESLPVKVRPLPGRKNIVISSRTKLDLPSGVEHARSFEQALAIAKDWQCARLVDKVFVIGGASLYNEAVVNPNCIEVYVTLVHSPHFDTEVRLSKKAFEYALGLIPKIGPATAIPPITTTTPTALMKLAYESPIMQNYPLNSEEPTVIYQTLVYVSRKR